jgi:hypothetical protein
MTTPPNFSGNLCLWQLIGISANGFAVYREQYVQANRQQAKNQDIYAEKFRDV